MQCLGSSYSRNDRRSQLPRNRCFHKQSARLQPNLACYRQTCVADMNGPHRIATTPTEQLCAEFRGFLTTQPVIILGTQSSSRRAIMDDLARQFSFKYTCQVAGIDEEAIRDPNPATLVRLLARAKAAAILDKLRNDRNQQQPEVGQPAALSSYLITCDQVVLYNGAIREKPLNEQQAREWIGSYSQLPAVTCGSTRVVNLGNCQSAEDVDYTETHFGAIPDESIDMLLKEGEVMWCSGALMVEHPLVAPHLLNMKGTQDAVMGLSKETVMRLLVELWRQQQA